MKSAGSVKKRDGALSRRRIAEGALDILRSRGLGALSARRLAAEMGCEAMSLYHYFDGMEDILDQLVDLILESLAPPARQRTSDPEKAILARARRYLDLSRSDPECFRLIATRRWLGPNGAARAREMTDLFIAAGVEERKALAAARALGAYIHGAGLALSAWRNRKEDARPVIADLDAGLKTLIAALIAKG